ncbi:MAG: hypothetical protein Q7R52_03480 [archaeon]|nr:hypothetical protein [archaeon]
MKTLTKNLINAAVLTAFSLAPANVKANDIFIGVKGPTNHQIDSRIGYSERSNSNNITTNTLTNNEVLKYWDKWKSDSWGDFGVFGFTNIPIYKRVDNGTNQNSGFGDLVLGVGPRGKLNFGKNSFNFLSYAGANIPTGDVHEKPALGNDRTDLKLGLFGTYLTENNKKEIDAQFEYTFAGRNSKGVKGLDEISAGLIAGGRLDKDNLVRIAAGINSRFKNNDKGWDYAYGPRAVIRVTPPKSKYHLEIVGDYDLTAKNMPKGFGVTFQHRRNF